MNDLTGKNQKKIIKIICDVHGIEDHFESDAKRNQADFALWFTTNKFEGYELF